MKRKVRLLPVMLACFGTLVVVSIGVIIAINSVTSSRVFSQLLGQAISQSVGGLELAVRSHLDAAEHHTDFVIESILNDQPPLGDEDRVADFAAGSLAAAPQIGALLIADHNGRVLALRRGEFGLTEAEWLDAADDPELAGLHAQLLGQERPSWGEPVYNEPLSATILYYSAPIWREDKFLGYVVATISTQALSNLANELSERPHSQVFVLYGDDKILAHSYMILQPGDVSVEEPLLGIDDILDPVIQRLDEVKLAPDEVSTDGVNLGQVIVNGTRYGVASKPVTGYGETPLTIGAYFDGSDVRSLVRSMFQAILIAAVVLAGVLLMVVILSRAVARPVRQTSEVAKSVASLEFDGIEPLPGSRLREFDDLATSFNAMLVGLKSFGRYVPRNLVRQLIREHRAGAGTEERQLTVMFTDIVGFTPLCEGMTSAEVADFINDHLTLVTRCIKGEDGTIDKYIGDAVMAFWGAPDSLENPTHRALSAAAALQIALAEDNDQREARGLPRVRIRIGIHTGPLIVGDIGSPERINYTVIGDVVNSAQRIEELGKEVDPGAEAIVLVSKAVKDTLDDQFAFDDVGKMKLKGRRAEIQVYRLKKEASGTAPPEPTNDTQGSQP